MDKRIKKLWVDALRSGDYEQGNERLCNDGKYCCLGVLCDIAMRDGVEIKVNKRGDGLLLFDGNKYLPPVKVREWACMNSVNPGFEWIGGHFTTLAGRNDAGSTFEEIAQLIEDEVWL